MWGTLPLNLMKLSTHVRLDNALLEWLARRAAGVGGVAIYAHQDDWVPPPGSNQQLVGAPDPANGVDRRVYRLNTARHFADMTLVSDLRQAVSQHSR